MSTPVVPVKVSLKGTMTRTPDKAMVVKTNIRAGEFQGSAPSAWYVG